ncbi:uncharacterized protein LOC130630437 [Hydractinia symbiolongicarpus]|uniref:uncharacterized protein LOC130630437 n=1 Tax=Hydractinia symbiolongicarpus TaxID=13093 RepID=UPI00254FF90B|nr:uncharacterized protein LOC130630437 [Hydractinia symbiolongicarpus]
MSAVSDINNWQSVKNNHNIKKDKQAKRQKFHNMHTHPIQHEYQHKLNCLSIEAENAACKLLEILSLQNPISRNNKVNDPGEALSLVLNECLRNHTLLQKVEKLSYADYKWRVFDPSNVSRIRTKIDISQMDLTLLYDILRNVEQFRTCKSRSRRARSICVNASSGGNHTRKICCNVCMLCSRCLSHSGASCETEAIVDALVFMKDARNMSAHITSSECELIQDGSYGTISIARCSTWNDVMKGLPNAVETILNFIHAQNYILKETVKKACLRMETVVNFTVKEYSNFYSNQIDRITWGNNAINAVEKPLIVRKTLSMDLRGQESLWTRVARSMCLGRETSDIDSPRVKAVIGYYTKNVTQILKKELGKNAEQFEISQPFVDSLPPEDGYSFLYHVQVDITFNNTVPDCYKMQYSSESENLRSYFRIALEDLLSNELNQDVKVEATKYRFASIHITFNIRKKFKWTNEEVQKVSAAVPNLASRSPSLLNYLNQQFGNWYNLTCNFIPATSSREHTFLCFDLSSSHKEVIEQIDAVWPRVCEKAKESILQQTNTVCTSYEQTNPCFIQLFSRNKDKEKIHDVCSRVFEKAKDPDEVSTIFTTKGIAVFPFVFLLVIVIVVNLLVFQILAGSLILHSKRDIERYEDWKRDYNLRTAAKELRLYYHKMSDQHDNFNNGRWEDRNYFLDKDIISHQEFRKIFFLNTREEQISQQLNQRGNVKLAHLLKEKKENIFLLQGAGGTGKTFLTQEIAMHWAQGKSWTNFKFVFHFKCRDFGYFNKKNMSFEEVWKLKYRRIFKHISVDDILTISRQILFIFDGLEELPGFTTDGVITNPHNVFYNIRLKSNLFRESKVIITGRPNAVTEFQKLHSSLPMVLIHMTGCSDHCVDAYIEKSFRHNASKLLTVNNLLKKNQSFKLMLKLPTNLVSFCHTMKYNNMSISSYDIYTFQLLNYLKKHYYYDKTLPNNARRGLLRIAQLEEIMKAVACAARLSFDMLAKRSTLTYGTKLASREQIKEMEKIGFFTMLKLQSGQIMYKYVQPAMQEFLAAVYVTLETVKRPSASQKLRNITDNMNLRLFENPKEMRSGITNTFIKKISVAGTIC